MRDAPVVNEAGGRESALALERGAGSGAVLGPLVRSSGTAAAGGLLSQTLKFFAVVFIARTYGPTDFGSFAFANSVNAFLFVIAQFGLPVFGAREVAQNGGASSGLLRAITGARARLAVIGTAVALAALSSIPGVMREELLLILGFGLSNVALAWLYDWTFQGMGKLGAWATLNVVWQALWLLLIVASFRAGASVVGVSFDYAIGAAVAALVGWFWLRRTLQGDRLSPSGDGYSRWGVLGSGAALGVSTLLVTVLVWSDTFLVRLIKGQTAAGVYAAGNRAGLALAMLASFYVLGAFPHLSQSAAASPAEFSKRFQRAYEDLGLLFVPGALWAMLYAPGIMLLLFKREDYLAGVPVFRIFQGFLLVSVIANLYGVGGLVAHRRDRSYRRALVVSVIALLVLCPALTLRWGLVGAALAALFSQALSLALFVMEGRGIVQVDHVKALVPAVLFGIAASASCFVLRLGLWSATGLLAATYIVILARRWPDWRTAVE